MKEQTRFLGEEKISRLLVQLSLPAIIGMMVQASYNIVDALFIGRGVGALGLAGTAVAFPFQLMVLAVATTGGVGAASVISRNLGSGNVERADRALGTLLSTSLAFSAIALLLIRAFMDPMLAALGTTTDTFPYAKTYLSVILFGIPLQIMGIGLNNAVRAEGRARIAMGTMLISALTNIALDPIFIFGLHMGIAGAAWATVISQGAVVIWLGHFYLTGRSSLTLRIGHLLPQWNLLREMLAVGASEFARLSANTVLVTILVRSLGSYGSELDVAAYGVISRVLSLTFMPIFGVGQGLQPILGYNYGARRYDRAHEVIYRSVFMASGFAVAAFLSLTLLPGPIFGLFTADAELRKIGAWSLRLMNLALFSVGFQVMGAATFQALGKAGPALFLSLSRQVLLFIPMLILMPRFFGLAGVWLAFPVSDLLASILTLCFFLPEMRDLKKKEAALRV